MVLCFWVGERHEGSAPLISDLVEEHKGLKPGWSFYMDTDKPDIILCTKEGTATVNFKVFGVTRPGIELLSSRTGGELSTT